METTLQPQHATGDPSLAGAVFESRRGPLVELMGREFVAFGGCDYLGLASDPRLAGAAAEAAECHGMSTGGSRTTTGNTVAHTELEDAIARFYHPVLPERAAIVTLDGLTANMAATAGLVSEGGVCVLDERSHATQVIAARAAGAQVVRYAHADASHLAQVVNSLDDPSAAVVMTDGVFAATGRPAPVKELLAALPDGATLLVDDCHGLGVTGRTGRGTPEASGLRDDRLVITCTLAKAVGAGGGFVLGSPSLIDRIREGSSVYVGTTPISPSLAAAARAGLGVISGEPERLSRLRRRSSQLLDSLRSLSDESAFWPGVPVHAVPLPAGVDASRFESHTRAYGLVVPVIRYPGGPASEYVRASVSALHTTEHMDRLAEAMATLRP